VFHDLPGCSNKVPILQSPAHETGSSKERDKTMKPRHIIEEFLSQNSPLGHNRSIFVSALVCLIAAIAAIYCGVSFIRISGIAVFSLGTYLFLNGFTRLASGKAFLSGMLQLSLSILVLLGSTFFFYP
jgi:hypothetical protein